MSANPEIQVIPYDPEQPVTAQQLRDAVQLAVFRLFDRRDPATARVELVLIGMAQQEFEIPHTDPYLYDLDSFTLRVERDAHHRLVVIADAEVLA